MATKSRYHVDGHCVLDRQTVTATGIEYCVADCRDEEFAMASGLPEEKLEAMACSLARMICATLNQAQARFAPHCTYCNRKVAYGQTLCPACEKTVDRQVKACRALGRLTDPIRYQRTRLRLEKQERLRLPPALR